MNLRERLNRKYNNLILYLSFAILKLSQHKDLKLPYSNLNFTVHKIIYDDRCIVQSNTESPIKVDLYFGHEVYTQSNDLRSYLHNILDEEASRIFGLQKLFSAAQLRYDVTFFDIGANYGTYSLPAAESDIHAILVEPNPFVCACLSRTYRDKNVTIVNKAIVDSGTAALDSEISINLMPSLSGSSSVSSQIVREENTQYEVFELEVECVTIDELCLLADASSDFGVFKIDIEGLELKLFKDDLINKIRSRFEHFVLMVEYVPAVMSENEAKDLRNYLTELPTIILSDKNYRFNHRHLSKNFSSFGALGAQDIKLKHIFNELKLLSKKEAAAKLKQVTYADVLVFSSKDLAEQLLAGFD